MSREMQKWLGELPVVENDRLFRFDWHDCILLYIITIVNSAFMIFTTSSFSY